MAETKRVSRKVVAGGRKAGEGSGARARKKKTARAGGRRQERGIPRKLREIYGVAAITLSVLLFLAFFIDALGPVGRGLDWFFSYLVGGVRFALPFMLLALGLALLLGRVGPISTEHRHGWRFTWVEASGIMLFLPMLCAFIHLSRSGNPDTMFATASLSGGGGLVGAAIAWPLVKLLSRAGAYVLVTGALISALLLLAEPTLSSCLKERVAKRREKRKGEKEHRMAAASLPAESVKGAAAKSGPPPKKAAAPRSVPEEGTAETVVPRPPLAREEEEAIAPLVVEDTGQMAMGVGGREKGRAFRLPPLELLARGGGSSIVHKSVNEMISVLERTLGDFGVDAAVTTATRGPTVTRFEVELGSGVKVNRVLNLSGDIAYALASPDIRIITPIPGKSAIGIEIPNRERDMVFLGDILDTPQARKMGSPLRVGLGKDVSGAPVVVDLRDMPHLLLAGATGTGKSCCINAMVTSVLFTSPPQEVRMIMIDPKYVELTHFNGIPHLLTPVITDPKKASAGLAWVVREMEARYQVLSRAGVKNIVAYRSALKEGLEKDVDEKGETVFAHMPYILVVIDELADLMMVAPSEVEDSVARIAQMARAVGIHLVVATQRPSVDVVTGLIKANMPSRIAFTVASQADSRVVLDMGGAEKLVGHGDMLFLPAGSSKPLRMQGAYISEREITAVIAFLKRQAKADYREDIIEETGSERREHAREDDLLDEAVEIVVRSGVASASLLQRKLRVGYARAARLVDLMEEMGVVGGYEGSKPRSVLMSPEELEEARRREARQTQGEGS